MLLKYVSGFVDLSLLCSWTRWGFIHQPFAASALVFCQFHVTPFSPSPLSSVAPGDACQSHPGLSASPQHSFYFFSSSQTAEGDEKLTGAVFFLSPPPYFLHKIVLEVLICCFFFWKRGGKFSLCCHWDRPTMLDVDARLPVSFWAFWIKGFSNTCVWMC